jgi:hypothetical protein
MRRFRAVVLPLMKLVRPQSLVGRRARESLVPHGRVQSLARGELGRLVSSTGPHCIRSGSSSLVVPLLQSSSHSPASYEALPTWVLALFATSPKASTDTRIPTLADVPSSGFLSLPTVYSASGFAGFFRPANRVQGSTSDLEVIPSNSSSPATTRLGVISFPHTKRELPI